MHALDHLFQPVLKDNEAYGLTILMVASVLRARSPDQPRAALSSQEVVETFYDELDGIRNLILKRYHTRDLTRRSKLFSAIVRVHLLLDGQWDSPPADLVEAGIAFCLDDSPLPADLGYYLATNLAYLRPHKKLTTPEILDFRRRCGTHPELGETLSAILRAEVRFSAAA